MVEVFVDDLSSICYQSLALFRQYNVPHVVRNIVHDPEARRDFYMLKLQFVPSFVLAGRIYEGFNPNLMGQLLKMHYDIEIPRDRLVVGLPINPNWWKNDDDRKPIISLPTA